MKTFILSVVCVVLISSSAISSQAEVLNETLDDGARIRLYYNNDIIKSANLTDDYPRRVLAAAKRAYELLVKGCGFSSEGYTFVKADKSYAYDPDQTIDIYIGDPDSSQVFYGYTAEDFKTAYFDPRDVRGEPNACEAIILFPTRIDILRERAVSTSHVDDEDTVILGTMAHEMTHLINYYYNKNLKKASGTRGTAWFVEGLARYMETRAGSWDSFYSRGYVRKIPEGYAYLEEGVNYFMKHPNRTLDNMAYDYAIFWGYFDEYYGMENIERLCREFRNLDGGSSYMRNLQAIFEKITGYSMQTILESFAYYIYTKSLDPSTRDSKIDEIRHDSVKFDGRKFLLSSAEHKQRPARMRIYRAKGIKPWAIDVHKVTFDCEIPPVVKFRNRGRGKLALRLVSLEGGNLQKATVSCVIGESESLMISKRNGVNLDVGDGFYLLVTNLSNSQDAAYEITASSR